MYLSTAGAELVDFLRGGKVVSKSRAGNPDLPSLFGIPLLEHLALIRGSPRRRLGVVKLADDPLARRDVRVLTLE
jgi:hypothetical protein